MKMLLSSMMMAAALAAVAGPETILGKVRQQGAEQQTIGNLKQIVVGMLMYAGDNQNFLPDAPGAAGLAKMKPYGMETSIFVAEYDRNTKNGAWESFSESNTSFLYLGNVLGNLKNIKAPSSVPLVVEKPSARNGNGTIVAFADGHVAKIKNNDDATVTDIIKTLRDQSGAKDDAAWNELLKVAAGWDAKQKND